MELAALAASLASPQGTFAAAQEIKLEPALGEEPLRLFQEMLGELDHRKNTVRNITSFTSAYAGTDREEFFRISDLRPESAEGRSGDNRHLTRLLDNGGCKAPKIRRRLAAAAAPRAQAMVLEIGDIEPTYDHPGYEIASLTMVGPGLPVPVWFERAEIKKSNRHRVQDLEHRLAHDLVAQAGEELGEIGVEPPPLIAGDRRHGENHLLRRHLREMGCPFLLRIPSDFVEAPGPTRSGDSARERFLLDQQMPFADDGSPPEPRLICTGPPRGAHEYIFGMPGDPPGYGLIHPGILAAPGGLTGHRGRQRGAEFLAIARAYGRPLALERLGLLRFLHPDDEGWRAAATLLAARWAAVLGCLGPSPR